MARTEAARRVLMTADAVGGVWTYAVELCRELGRRGTDVLVAVMGPPPSTAQRVQLTGLPHVRLEARGFALEWMDDPWADVQAAGTWLLDLERQFEPEVVHLNGYCHASLEWRAPCLAVGHSCVLSWWQAVHGADAPSGWSRYAEEVARGLRRAAVVVAPSAAMQASLERLYGPLPRTKTIHNGRSRHDAAVSKEPLIMTAGRLWDPAKNVAAVLEAARSLPWPTVVAGPLAPDGAGAAPVGVRYLGALPEGDVRSWMARASIYALPARYEPFGLSALEAAMAGCALVLGDTPSLREVWADAAVYVEPEDHAGLQRVLAALIQDDRRRQALAQAALERAGRFTARRMADEYGGTYSELIRERRSLLSLSAV